jgi:prevent-host-death family protein
MTEFHPNILSKHGKPEFVVLPYEEYESLLEWLTDLEDLLELRRAKQEEQDAPTMSLEEVKQLLGHQTQSDWPPGLSWPLTAAVNAGPTKRHLPTLRGLSWVHLQN